MIYYTTLMQESMVQTNIRMPMYPSTNPWNQIGGMEENCIYNFHIHTVHLDIIKVLFIHQLMH